MDKRVSDETYAPDVRYAEKRNAVTTTSTETYEILTRSICASSMPNVPCYVCAFGLPTAADLVTVTVVCPKNTYLHFFPVLTDISGRRPTLPSPTLNQPSP